MLAVAHKAVAKAEGRVVALADVAPGARALALAAEHGKDPRLVELILAESAELVRADAGRLHLPHPPRLRVRERGRRPVQRRRRDARRAAPARPGRLGARAARAARLRGRRHRLVRPRVARRPGRGRDRLRRARAAWTTGAAGPTPAGRVLHATQIAVADEAAAAADLVRGKDTGEPAVRLRGLERHVLDGDGPGAAALLRARDQDLFG